jgi:hypothetical protein
MDLVHRRKRDLAPNASEMNDPNSYGRGLVAPGLPLGLPKEVYMADKSTAWGPENSGDQEAPGEKSGGDSTVNSDGSYHHTDYAEGAHASWDESSSGVSGQHTTDHDTGEITDHSDSD